MSADILRFDLSGVAVDVRVRESDVAGELARIWSGFERPAARAEAWLDLAVESSAGPMADVPGKHVEARRDPAGAIEIDMDEGRVTFDRRGRGTIDLRAGGDAPRRAWALHNLLLAALAWRLASENRGAVVHAASIVVDGRAYLLVGAEGAGKSTFAAQAARGGEAVLGEDVAVLELGPDGAVSLGSPFRVENATRRGSGRWPVAAVLLPKHGAPPSVDAVDRVRAQAALAANLPYLADAEVALTVARAILDRTAVRSLTFSPDPTYLGALRAFDAGGGCASGGPRR